MEEKIFSFSYKKYANINELPTDLRMLMQKAVEARQRAYAPYSSFVVGASILLDNGEIISGNNQENAAFPSGLCAERVAIFYAMAQYPNAKILKIAITGTKIDSLKETPVTPCGNCRQAILEYESVKKHPIEILCMGATGEILVVSSVSELLPFCFDKLPE